MVEKSDIPGMSVSVVERRNGVSPGQLFNWRCLAGEGKLSAIRSGEDVVAASEVKQLLAGKR